MAQLRRADVLLVRAPWGSELELAARALPAYCAKAKGLLVQTAATAAEEEGGGAEGVGGGGEARRAYDVIVYGSGEEAEQQLRHESEEQQARGRGGAAGAGPHPNTVLASGIDLGELAAAVQGRGSWARHSTGAEAEAPAGMHLSNMDKLWDYAFVGEFSPSQRPLLLCHRPGRRVAVRSPPGAGGAAGVSGPAAEAAAAAIAQQLEACGVEVWAHGCGPPQMLELLRRAMTVYAPAASAGSGGATAVLLAARALGTKVEVEGDNQWLSQLAHEMQQQVPQQAGGGTGGAGGALAAQGRWGLAALSARLHDAVMRGLSAPRAAAAVRIVSPAEGARLQLPRPGPEPVGVLQGFGTSRVRVRVRARARERKRECAHVRARARAHARG
jgi:hypothetical protein